MALRRSSKDLLGIPRALGRSHGLTQRDLYREQAASAKSVLDKAGKFLKIQVFGWVFHYFKTRFGGREEFRTYRGLAGDNGIYRLRGATSSVKVTLAGDWGTGTEEAFSVGRLIERGRPDFTIHLGDVYYVGSEKEVLENMMGGQVSWPRGSQRSFALNGNHEMYARGKAYFVNLLPDLQQHASFFALRNDQWLLIGLDTGYNSVGIPVLEKLWKPSHRLPDELVQWLRDDVQIDRDTARGIVLLSHHQYYSAFEDQHEQAARQLERLIKRPVLWLWGHEHRFALYGKARGQHSTLEVYGRCVGHGGMPLEDIGERPDERKAQRTQLVLYDHRERTRLPEADTPIGYNGYAELLFDGPNLVIEYSDIDRHLIVRERWSVGAGGKLTGVAIDQPTTHPRIVNYRELGAAIA